MKTVIIKLTYKKPLFFGLFLFFFALPNSFAQTHSAMPGFICQVSGDGYVSDGFQLSIQANGFPDLKIIKGTFPSWISGLAQALFSSANLSSGFTAIGFRLGPAPGSPFYFKEIHPKDASVITVFDSGSPFEIYLLDNNGLEVANQLVTNGYWVAQISAHTKVSMQGAKIQHANERILAMSVRSIGHVILNMQNEIEVPIDGTECISLGSAPSLPLFSFLSTDELLKQ